MAVKPFPFAAGILFITPDERVLLLRRSDKDTSDPGLWCIPGGKAEAGEDPLTNAIRETDEEAGTAWRDVADGEPVLWTQRPTATGGIFSTYLQRVSDAFAVTLSEEHSGAAWFPLDALPADTLPQMMIAINRFYLDELGIARAIQAGELTSPQKYANVWLFDIRVTGTGASYRPGINEYVWRPPEQYLDDEFLARCNGLPVVWLHPEGEFLSSQDFRETVVGTIFLPYIKGDEVWCIAKVYDEDAALLMRAAQLSTSPGVWGVGGKISQMAGEDHALLEEKPLLLDHLAVVDVGVWDKGGPPVGVSKVSTIVTNHGESDMPEETAAEAQKDSLNATAECADPVLSRLDALAGVLDSLATRMDSYDAAKADRAKKDAEEAEKARKDAEEAEAARKDAEALKALEDEKAKKDAEEAAKAAHTKEGEDIDKLAADHNTEGSKMDNASETAKHDAEIAGLKAQLAALKAAVAGPSMEDADTLLSVQSRYDSVAVLLGTRADRAQAGENSLAYRKRLARKIQAHSKDWSGVNLSVLEGKAFDVAESAILRDAAAFATSAESVPANELRMIKRFDSDTGHNRVDYVGSASACWGPFMRPRRVASLAETRTRAVIGKH